MGKTDGLQEFLNRMARDREQAEVANEVLFGLISNYYTSLVKNGVPNDLAGLLCRDFQDALLSGLKKGK